MFKKLFGTDGIRGILGDKISSELAFDIGKAVAIVFKREDETDTFVVGRDTRLSCDTLESGLIAGITSVGANVILLGVVPSAVVPFSIKHHKANAGIMITASHNTSEYNGFKFFNGNGFKISEEQEDHIEHVISNSSDYFSVKFKNLGRITKSRVSVRKYVKFIRDELKLCKKTRVCFDCANGCASGIIKEIFKNYTYMSFNSLPNGLNINANCGANHIEELQKIMEVGDFDVGFSFDGDADRVRVVLRGGEIVSGEDITYLLVKFNNYSSVTTTKMSNMALIHALEKEDIPCFITDIGEKAILNTMLENNSRLGTENNGHYLLLDKTTSSDGILIAAEVLSVYETDNSLAVPFKPYHQLEKAIPVKNKNEIIRNCGLLKTIEICESLLFEDGRILVRPSGTEEVVRILVEGEKPQIVEKVMKKLEEAVEMSKQC